MVVQVVRNQKSSPQQSTPSVVVNPIGRRAAGRRSARAVRVWQQCSGESVGKVSEWKGACQYRRAAAVRAGKTAVRCAVNARRSYNAQQQLKEAHRKVEPVRRARWQQARCSAQAEAMRGTEGQRSGVRP